jgi:hypothetical protein
MSAVLTLMIPYYKIDSNAAFAAAFEYRGIEWAKDVVSVGALAAMTTLQRVQSIKRNFISC